MPSLDEARESINRMLADNRSAEAQARQIQHESQAWISKIIIWTFVLTIGAIFLLVLGHQFMPRTSIGIHDGWYEAANFLADFVASVLLPVVTLVVGYYFGTMKTG